MLHDRDLHSLRSAAFLYHEAMLHDRDLHSLRSAVLLYHILYNLKRECNIYTPFLVLMESSAVMRYGLHWQPDDLFLLR